MLRCFSTIAFELCIVETCSVLTAALWSVKLLNFLSAYNLLVSVSVPYCGKCLSVLLTASSRLPYKW